MIAVRKHIAIILLGVFIFPVVFQQVHIMRHHSHDHGACILVMDPDSPDGNKVSSQRKDSHCLLCEYKLSVISLLDIVFITSTVNIIEDLETELVSFCPLQILFSSESPRAPPLRVS